MKKYKNIMIFMGVILIGLLLEKLNVISQITFFVSIQIIAIVIANIVIITLIILTTRHNNLKRMELLKKYAKVIVLIIICLFVLICLSFIISRDFRIDFWISYEIICFVAFIAEALYQILFNNKEKV